MERTRNGPTGPGSFEKELQIQFGLMDNFVANLSDADLASRLTNFEDHFVERKTSGDQADWVKTVVAFANSTPIGYPAVLFIGVKTTGPLKGISIWTVYRRRSPKR